MLLQIALNINAVPAAYELARAFSNDKCHGISCGSRFY